MTSWVDATGFIDQTCAELGPEELVHGENFSLYEAMLAIEIGDSRMDIGMKRGETPPAEVLLAQGRAPVDLEPAQMEALAMQLLQAETTWHQGALLPATVFSSLYMLDLDRLRDNTSLHCLCVAVQLSCTAVHDLVLKGHVCEDEDISIHTFGMNLLAHSGMQPLQLLMTEAPAESGKREHAGVWRHIHLRLEFLQGLFALLKATGEGVRAMQGHVDKALKLLDRIEAEQVRGQDQPATADPPTDLGFVPSVNIQRVGTSAAPRAVRWAAPAAAVAHWRSTLGALREAGGAVLRVRSWSELRAALGALAARDLHPIVRSAVPAMLAAQLGVDPAEQPAGSPAREFLEQGAVAMQGWTHTACLNRCRQRRRHRRLLGDWANMADHAAFAARALRPAALAPRLLDWVEAEAAGCELLHLQLGFPLELYAPHEYAGVYWYSDYLLLARQGRWGSPTDELVAEADRQACKATLILLSALRAAAGGALRRPPASLSSEEADGWTAPTAPARALLLGAATRWGAVAAAAAGLREQAAKLRPEQLAHVTGLQRIATQNAVAARLALSVAQREGRLDLVPSWDFSTALANSTCMFFPILGLKKDRLRQVETGQLLSDALSSALQSALGVPECALQLSEGQACALSGPSAACASPFYVCGGAVLSSDLYQLAVSGECASSASSSTSDCKLLEAQLGSSTLQGRTCTASCVLPDVNNLTALLSPAVEAPAPAGETEDENGTCASFSVQILAATEADAEALSTTLVSDKAAATVIGGVAAFATRATEFVAYPSGAWVSNSSSGSKNRIVLGSWSNCSASCGSGWQVRSATCLSASGASLPLASCDGSSSGAVSEGDLLRACSTGVRCSEAHWVYGAWGACNATCGGGWASRSAECSAATETACVASQGAAETLLACNTAACEVGVWASGPWSACSASCGGGTQTRTTRCVSAESGGHAARRQLRRVGAAGGAARLRGRRLRVRGRHRLVPSSATCACSAGYGGSACSVPASCSAVDGTGACCASDLVSAGGACCPAGASLDASGACCASGTLDACGVCDGKAKSVDVRGACCSSGVSDAAGICCASGGVDACGVCDGLGTTCALGLDLLLAVNSSLVGRDGVVEAPLLDYLDELGEAVGISGLGSNATDLHLSVAASSDSSSGVKSRRRRSRLLLAQAPLSEGSDAAPSTETPSSADSSTISVSLTVPAGLANGSVPLSTAWLESQLTPANSATSDSTIASLERGASAQRTAVCGNGVCELGEIGAPGSNSTGTCPQDCPVATATGCAGSCGSGRCDALAGTCLCFVGYTGATCDECAAGFVANVQGSCSADVAQLGILHIAGAAPAPAAESPAAEGPAAEAPGPEQPAAAPSDLGPAGAVPPSSPAPPAAPTSSSSNKAGVIAGATVGAVAALVLLVLGICCCVRRRRRGQRDAAGGIDPRLAKVIAKGTGHDPEAPRGSRKSELSLRQRYGTGTNSSSSWDKEEEGKATRIAAVHVSADPALVVGALPPIAAEKSLSPSRLAGSGLPADSSGPAHSARSSGPASSLGAVAGPGLSEGAAAGVAARAALAAHRPPHSPTSLPSFNTGLYQLDSSSWAGTSAKGASASGPAQPAASGATASSASGPAAPPPVSHTPARGAAHPRALSSDSATTSGSAVGAGPKDVSQPPTILAPAQPRTGAPSLSGGPPSVRASVAIARPATRTPASSLGSWWQGAALSQRSLDAGASTRRSAATPGDEASALCDSAVVAEASVAVLPPASDARRTDAERAGADASAWRENDSALAKYKAAVTSAYATPETDPCARLFFNPAFGTSVGRTPTVVGGALLPPATDLAVERAASANAVADADGGMALRRARLAALRGGERAAPVPRPPPSARPNREALPLPGLVPPSDSPASSGVASLSLVTVDPGAAARAAPAAPPGMRAAVSDASAPRGAGASTATARQPRAAPASSGAGSSSSGGSTSSDEILRRKAGPARPRAAARLPHPVGSATSSEASGARLATAPPDVPRLPLVSTYTPQPATSQLSTAGGPARSSLSEGLRRLLSPFAPAQSRGSNAEGSPSWLRDRSARATADWAAQMSARGQITPRSWRGDSGMMRSRPETPLDAEAMQHSSST
ncbi:hypothetical protein QBZ16_000663 [Prototheca wickerhamii]|uniref:EGF-like domain-containing protein n=1 Tax=Prototheca wickerhamii TaxID=3111 RepID=A0AAD9ILK4_PROWI|nr:hypothetical protein QBZ16_000663 [Prototheca wickerhamii]